ncbi:2-oxo-4-hydroxy-4-carboxy-5-ureidoimidazoline decarboxylase [Methylobacterium marchantiae]|uniref:2-oxo-4-hydroxy-4-carboxy-5-ureidoimidazoline decarboxylase n=1 Tax=Methylobacterium marchantiae TaxID=600331 RepID=A0ABW3WZ78_9HYPH|nr:hypothetical protein AIGOOFII_2084 [Methylobacterium marchantiae]
MPPPTGAALLIGLALMGPGSMMAPGSTPIVQWIVERRNEVALPDMDAVNALSRQDFVTTFGGVFENSPWVAERAASARPFASPAALHAAMMAVVRAAPSRYVLAFLNAHPELAGAEARARQMTAHSSAEQGSAGLDRMTEADFDRFARLNAAYRATFGFPFIIAVRGRTKDAILAEFERRLANPRDVERDAALAEIALITRMRLERILGPFD